MTRKVLILAAPDGAMRPLERAFTSVGGKAWDSETVRSAPELLARVAGGGTADAIVVDYPLGDGTMRGAELVRLLRAAAGSTPIVATAEHGDVATAAETVQAGATDFLVRAEPMEDRVATLLGKMAPTMRLLDENRALRDQSEQLEAELRAKSRIMGDSPQIAELLRRIRRVARVPRPVLITGERGTGKELVARAIHEASDRAARPLVTVNCAAFPDTLLESELFGHERGAFTGADRLVRGKFELADGGTLFLDEIGTMSVPFQQKILRVVEYGTYTRVGGATELKTRARLLAATNANLEEMMARGDFLRDLYDRLSFEVIHVPALRERTGDVESLAHHFLTQFMREIPAFQGKRLSREAIESLKKYPFPGNVRELKNIIERAAYRDSTNEITPGDFGLLQSTAPSVAGSGLDFESSVRAYKARLLGEALAASRGNQAEAARRLGLSYHQFRYYHQRLLGGGKNAS